MTKISHNIDFSLSVTQFPTHYLEFPRLVRCSFSHLVGFHHSNSTKQQTTVKHHHHIIYSTQTMKIINVTFLFMLFSMLFAVSSGSYLRARLDKSIADHRTLSESESESGSESGSSQSSASTSRLSSDDSSTSSSSSSSSSSSDGSPPTRQYTDCSMRWWNPNCN